MLSNDVTIVGSKGEILPKKKLRNISGIFQGDQVIIRASANALLIKKILTVEEALKLPIIDSSNAKDLKIQIKEEINKIGFSSNEN